MVKVGLSVAYNMILCCILLEFQLTSAVISLTAAKALVGSQVRLKCVSSTEGDVLWAYHNTSTGEMQDVYLHGLIVNGYRGKFWKTTSADGGDHFLVIPRVESCDAGLYCCVERDGVGEEHLVLLSVIDKSDIKPQTTPNSLGSTLTRETGDMVNGSESVPLNNYHNSTHNDTINKSCRTEIVISLVAASLGGVVVAVLIGCACAWVHLHRHPVLFRKLFHVSSKDNQHCGHDSERTPLTKNNNNNNGRTVSSQSKRMRCQSEPADPRSCDIPSEMVARMKALAAASKRKLTGSFHFVVGVQNVDDDDDAVFQS